MSVTALEETIISSNAEQVKAKRMELKQNLEAKHMGYIVRSRMRAMGHEGINAAGWTRVTEA